MIKTLTKFKGIACILGLVSAALWLTACRDTGSEPGSNNTGGGGTTGGTNAPVSIGGRSFNHSINHGSGPFSSSGTFLFRAGGASGDTSGSYTIIGSGGVTNSTGTYNYTTTAANTATLLRQDSLIGSVTESLTFLTPNNGTFSSTAAGGTQDGTFFFQ